MEELLHSSSLQGAVSETQYPWYAVRVRSRHEEITSRNLRSKGYCEFAPFFEVIRQWSDRKKRIKVPLFPGYVFCRMNPLEATPVLRSPGVASIVSFGKQFIPVDETEIASIQSICGSGAQVKPWPYLRVGQRIRICSGPLNGVEGLLLELKDSRRLVASVTLLRRSVSVVIERETIEPVF